MILFLHQVRMDRADRLLALVHLFESTLCAVSASLRSVRHLAEVLPRNRSSGVLCIEQHTDSHQGVLQKPSPSMAKWSQLLQMGNVLELVAAQSQ